MLSNPQQVKNQIFKNLYKYFLSFEALLLCLFLFFWFNLMASKFNFSSQFQHVQFRHIYHTQTHMQQTNRYISLNLLLLVFFGDWMYYCNLPLLVANMWFTMFATLVNEINLISSPSFFFLLYTLWLETLHTFKSMS